jgi:AcrR family transcriptional regulator
MSNKKAESLARAIEVARAMFRDKPFADVSIAEIAAMAKCSSATIYEAFASKSGLYEEVRLKETAPSWSLAPDAERSGLAGLISYFLGRVLYLGSPEAHNLIRSAPHNREAVRRNIEQSIQMRSQLGEVVAEVESCIASGLLKKADPQAIAYVLHAASGFEPVMYGQLFSEDLALEPAAIIRTVFSVLVTRKGRKAMDRLLPAERPPRETGYSLSGFLRTAARTPA